MEIHEGQVVAIQHSRFGKRTVIATVIEVMPNTARISYVDRVTRSSGCCVVKRSKISLPQ